MSSRIRNVTVADVARYAGVSSAVVSYVINDGPRPVAPATADRVRNAVAVLGYRPNTHARALRSGSTGILALIHPGTRNAFFGEYIDVLYDVAARHGIALLMASSAGSAHTENTLIDDLPQRGVDGIVVVTSMTAADVSALRDPGIPMLLVNCPFPVPGYRTIGPDAFDGARQAVEHLLTVHHHDTVAFIAGESGSPEPDDRERGWREALRSHRRAEGPLVRATFDTEGGFRAATSLLAGQPRPTAIFASSDLQAAGVLHAIHERRLAIPQDVAVVTFDGIAASAHTWPPLTTMRQPITAMAEAAISNILDASPPAHTLFSMQMITRQSCGCGEARPVE